MALTVSVEELVHTSKNPLLQVKDGWSRVRLGEVATVLNGYAFKSELFTRDEGTPLIRIRDVGSSASETRYKGEFDLRYLVKAGALLVGMDGDFNCARWRGEPSLLNQRVCKISLTSPEYDSRFLDYILPGYLKAINSATSSTTVKHLSSRSIEDIPLPKPSLVEQQQIVAEFEKQFSRLDEAVANLTRVKANLKRYKAAVLKSAVEGRLVPTEAELARKEGRDYETGEQLLKRILETRRKEWEGKGKYTEPAAPDLTDLPALPDGWLWTSVDQLAEVVRGASPRPAGDPKYFGGDIPWITVGTVTSAKGQFVRSAKETVTTLGKDNSRFIEAGTLLLSNSGATLGVPKISLISGCINDGVAALFVHNESIKLYLLHVFDSLTESLRRINQGAAQPNLNTAIIRDIKVALPPEAELQRLLEEIDRRVSIVQGIEGQVDLNLGRAERMRQSILSTAFSSADLHSLQEVAA